MDPSQNDPRFWRSLYKPPPETTVADERGGGSLPIDEDDLIARIRPELVAPDAPVIREVVVQRVEVPAAPAVAAAPPPVAPARSASSPTPPPSRPVAASPPPEPPPAEPPNAATSGVYELFAEEEDEDDAEFHPSVADAAWLDGTDDYEVVAEPTGEYEIVQEPSEKMPAIQVPAVALESMMDRVPRLIGGPEALVNARGLSQSAVMVLVLIDGGTSVKGLRALAPSHMDDHQFAAVLREAMQQGLIALD